MEEYIVGRMTNGELEEVLQNLKNGNHHAFLKLNTENVKWLINMMEEIIELRQLNN